MEGERVELIQETQKHIDQSQVMQVQVLIVYIWSRNNTGSLHQIYI